MSLARIKEFKPSYVHNESYQFLIARSDHLYNCFGRVRPPRSVKVSRRELPWVYADRESIERWTSFLQTDSLLISVKARLYKGTF